MEINHSRDNTNQDNDDTLPSLLVAVVVVFEEKENER